MIFIEAHPPRSEGEQVEPGTRIAIWWRATVEGIAYGGWSSVKLPITVEELQDHIRMVKASEAESLFLLRERIACEKETTNER